jgi:polyhydroxyalkanoate synthase
VTANVRSASTDRQADGRGDVPHDESAALESVENGEAVAIPSVGGFLRGLGLALAQAGPGTREAGRLARDAARIVRGTDDHLPSPKDKRFSDPAWSQNPVYRRVEQFYLASGSAASRLVDDLEAQDVDWHDVERARFAVNALTSALAPTNTPIGNPAALKGAFDTAGSSVVRGLRNLARRPAGERTSAAHTGGRG